HGKMAVLIQPAELVIIGGAAIGTILIANPPHILKKIVGGVVGVLKPSRYTEKFYLNALKMYFEVLNKARKEGLMSMEADVEEPEKSEIFKKYPEFLKDHHTRDFVCDTLRLAITGGVDPFDLDQMIEGDMEVAHNEAAQPIAALSTMAASLVGTVLGILLCYGFIGPVSSNMAKAAEEEHTYHQVIRVLLLSFIKG